MVPHSPCRYQNPPSHPRDFCRLIYLKTIADEELKSNCLQVIHWWVWRWRAFEDWYPEKKKSVFENGGRTVQSSIEVINHTIILLKLISNERRQIIFSFSVPYVRIGLFQLELQDFLLSISKKIVKNSDFEL